MNNYLTSQNGMCDNKTEGNKDKCISIEYFADVVAKIKGEFEETGRNNNLK